MKSTRDRRPLVLGLALALTASVLTGCIGGTGAERRAIDDAHEQIRAVTSRIAEDVAAMDDDDLVALVERGGLRVDRSFVGLDADEIAAQRGSPSETVLLEASESRLLLYTAGAGEGGGGIGDYEQVHVYLCWDLEVDIEKRTVGDARDAGCPAGIEDYAGAARLIGL
jgi:hypothetical protein